MPEPGGVDERPTDSPAFIAWLQGWSDDLVLLRPIPLDRLKSAFDHVELHVQRHLQTWEGFEEGAAMSTPEGKPPLREVIRSDHRRFTTSLEEFRGLLRVVVADDHGGHRQALGQYGRLVAAAFAQHLLDEAELARPGRGRALPPEP